MYLYIMYNVIININVKYFLITLPLAYIRPSNECLPDNNDHQESFVEVQDEVVKD